MTDALTQKELDSLGCGNPDCTSHDHSTIYMHCGNCSPDEERFAVYYEKPAGELIIECTTCARELVHIAVKA
jgi:hypothetical protein